MSESRDPYYPHPPRPHRDDKKRFDKNNRIEGAASDSAKKKRSDRETTNRLNINETQKAVKKLIGTTQPLFRLTDHETEIDEWGLPLQILESSNWEIIRIEKDGYVIFQNPENPEKQLRLHVTRAYICLDEDRTRERFKPNLEG